MIQKCKEAEKRWEKEFKRTLPVKMFGTSQKVLSHLARLKF